MASNFNFLLLLCLGCVVYFTTSTDVRRFRLIIDVPPQQSVAETAELLETELVLSPTPTAELKLKIRDYFKVRHRNKNIVVVDAPHQAKFKGSEHVRVKIEQPEGSIGFDVYVFDEGEFVFTGQVDWEDISYYGDYQIIGTRKIIFRKST